MDRREFLGAGAVAAATAVGLKPAQAAENGKKWWDEEDFVFEGTPATLFWWPEDRIICFDCIDGPLNRIGHRGQIMVPTFNLNDPRLNGTPIEEHMRSCIRCPWEHWETLHLHVIRIKTFPNVVAVILNNKKLVPTTNFVPEHCTTAYKE